MRILALDWGDVRIGAAISDPGGKIAFPLEKFIDSKGGEEEIKKIIDEQGVEKIIIGKPKNLAGNESLSSKKVDEFIKSLKKNIDLPLELIDERFTSMEAGKILSEQGINEQKQRSIKDNIAAQIMLQRYLDTNK